MVNKFRKFLQKQVFPTKRLITERERIVNKQNNTERLVNPINQ